MTTIEDTLTYIDGSKANGRLVVGWKPFTVGNVNAAGGELEWQIVEGAVSISLYSNTGAQPTGSYYVVKYELENGAVYLEQWIVPDLPTVNLGQVRVAFPPSPSVMISPLQLTSLGAAPGMFLMWNGQRWVPGYPGTFSFVDPTLVKGDMIVRGDVAPATRLGVGLDGLVLTANSSQPLGVSWTLVGGASSQTPWVVDINGAGHTLTNTGNVGIGNTLTALPNVHSPAVHCVVGNASTAYGELTVSGTTVALLNFANYQISVAEKRVASIVSIISGAGTNSGDMEFYTANAGVIAERMRITPAGLVGIGRVPTTYPLEVQGDVSVTGTYRINGVPIATSQTPWTQDIDAASHILYNVSKIGIGFPGPQYPLHVAGTTPQFAIGVDSNPLYNLQFTYTTSNATIQMVSNGLGASLMLNPNGGNVGIGANPQVPLHVVRTVAQASPPAAGTYGGTAIISNDSPTYGLYIGSLSTGNGYIQQQRGDSATTYNLLLQPNGGNVGIGTTGPNAQLSVIPAVTPSTLAAATQFTIGEASNNSAYRMALGFYSDAPNYKAVIQATNGTPAAGFLLLNPSGGNVGVGTTGPGAKLDVAGDVNCSTVFRVQGLPTARVIAYLDQTGARALNTVYLNTQTCPIFVAVTATINQSQFMQLLTDLGNPPTNVVCTQSNASGSLTITQTLNGWVMPNHYYKVNASGGTLAKWFEWQ